MVINLSKPSNFSPILLLPIIITGFTSLHFYNAYIVPIPFAISISGPFVSKKPAQSQSVISS